MNVLQTNRQGAILHLLQNISYPNVQTAPTRLHLYIVACLVSHRLGVFVPWWFLWLDSTFATWYRHSIGLVPNFLTRPK